MDPPGRDALYNDATLAFAGDVVSWLGAQTGKFGGIFRARLVGNKCVVIAEYHACLEALSSDALVASDAYAELLSGILGETTLLTMVDDSEAATETKAVVVQMLHHALGHTFTKSLYPALLSAVRSFPNPASVNLYEVVRDVFTSCLIEDIVGKKHASERMLIQELLKDHFRGASKPPVRGGFGKLWKTGFQRGLDSRDELLRRFSKLIEEHRHQGDVCPPSCPSLLCQLFRAKNARDAEGEKGLSDEQLGGILLVLSNSIIPKTVATLVASTAAAIAADRSLFEALRRERDELGGDTLQFVGPDMAGAMSTLRLCIRESGRLWPALVVAPRKCRRQTTIRGYKIAANSYVIVSLISANRDRSVYGDDAELFRPLRWEDQKLAPLTWGAGRRTCAGIEVAESIALLVLAELLHRYNDWRILPDSQPNRFKWLPVAAHQRPVLFAFG